MEERIHYLERRIEELLVRVSELEKQSAPAVTDADEYLSKEDIKNFINNYIPNIMQLNLIRDYLNDVD